MVKWLGFQFRVPPVGASNSEVRQMFSPMILFAYTGKTLGRSCSVAMQIQQNCYFYASLWLYCLCLYGCRISQMPCECVCWPWQAKYPPYWCDFQARRWNCVKSFACYIRVCMYIYISYIYIWLIKYSICIIICAVHICLCSIFRQQPPKLTPFGSLCKERILSLGNLGDLSILSNISFCKSDTPHLHLV